jgi:hypothetical protein
VASLVAVTVDRPRRFAIAGLAISLVTCLLIGSMIAAAVCIG